MARKKKTVPTPPDDFPTSFDCPESSSLKGATYDPGRRQMVVEFKDGSQYLYSGIESDEWERFVLATSKGSYFAKHIRTLYHGRKV